MKTGQMKTGQMKTGLMKTGQMKTGQTKIGRNMQGRTPLLAINGDFYRTADVLDERSRARPPMTPRLQRRFTTVKCRETVGYAHPLGEPCRPLRRDAEAIYAYEGSHHRLERVCVVPGSSRMHATAR